MASKPKAERAEDDAEIGRPKMLYGAVPRDRRRDNHDGYDCEFVEPPPEAVQTECPVCLLILKEPCLISCCGHKFCRVCVERVKKDKKPCPLCSEPDFSFMQERSLERFLKGLQVWCSYKKDGCEWEGKLGELEQHLNQSPSPENRLNGCQFVAVECTHECGEWFQRHHITSHETEQCKKRPYSCDYCRDYQSTFEEVTEIHYLQCSKYPVACPNECRVYKFERQELESHLRDQCPLTLVDCPFHYAGCQTQLPRKDMPEHMRETVTHLTLLASVTQTLVKENQDLRQTISEQQQTIAEIQQKELQHQEQQRVTDKELEENQQLQQRAMMKVHETLQSLKQQHQDKEKAIEQEIQALKKQLQQKVIRAEAYSQKRTETLQRMDRQYHDKPQTAIAGVETLKKENPMQRSLKRADKSSNNTDALIRKTDQQYQDKQTDIQTFEKVCILNFLVELSVVRTVRDVYSPAFYTHQRGYRMSVCVYPNGCGSGMGTHVSVYVHMMRGRFDGLLKWPFRGEITIQIVNQAGDHDHVEITIPYNDETPDKSAARVTGKERSDNGLGVPQFLAHTALPYNAVKKTQYLKDNHLIVRVAKVKLTTA